MRVVRFTASQGIQVELRSASTPPTTTNVHDRRGVLEWAFEAKPGEVVGPLKTSAGWELMTTLKTRKGTLGFDDVKDELAAEQIKQEKAVGIAKERAAAALALAKAAPDKSLKDVFAAPAEPEAKAEAKTAAKAGAKPSDGKAAAGAGIDARAEETGLFSRKGTVIEQIGDSPDLAKAVWELKPEAPLAGPFDVAGSYVVVRLKERKDPDPAELEKKKGELQRDAELQKWNEVVTGWVKSRCLDVKAAGRLTVNKSFLKYDESGADKEPPPAYEPCGGGEHPRRPS